MLTKEFWEVLERDHSPDSLLISHDWCLEQGEEEIAKTLLYLQVNEKWISSHEDQKGGFDGWDLPQGYSFCSMPNPKKGRVWNQRIVDALGSDGRGEEELLNSGFKCCKIFPTLERAISALAVALYSLKEI